MYTALILSCAVLARHIQRQLSSQIFSFYSKHSATRLHFHSSCVKHQQHWI